MLQRARLATQDSMSGGKLKGEVEVDETFIGGKARNMHEDVKARKIGPNRGRTVKQLLRQFWNVVAKFAAKVVDKRKKKDLQAMVRENVEQRPHYIPTH